MPCALKNEQGFTLTELVIMIVVVGLLATIAIPRYVDRSPYFFSRRDR